MWVSGKPNPEFDRHLAMQGVFGISDPGSISDEDIRALRLQNHPKKHSLRSIVGAAFQLENVVGSALSREYMPGPKNQFEEGYNPLDLENLRGFEDYAERFVDTRSFSESEALKRDILREKKNREIVYGSGLTGIAAAIGAGVIDPTILIPIGGTVKKGESLLKIGARFAAAGGGGAAVSEIALQETQVLRTAQESALNIAGGTFLGGLLGSAGAAAYRGITGKPIMQFADGEYDALARRLEDEMIYAPDTDPAFAPHREDVEAMNAQSAGAAAVEKPTLEDYELVPSGKLAESGAKIGLNPLLRLSVSASAMARKTANMLMENGMYLNRNRQGLASPQSVEQNMIEYRGWHGEARTTANKEYKNYLRNKDVPNKLNHTQFNDAISRAMRRGDKSDIPEVQRAAQAYRVAVENVKKRAIDAGLLPKDVDVTTAASYFHRMWNRRVLVRRPQDFERMVRAWAGETLSNIKVRAANIEAKLAKSGEKISPEDQEFIKQARQLADIEDIEGGLDDYINDITSHIYETLLGHDARTLPINITAGPRGPLKERTFNIRDDFQFEDLKVEDFLVNDAEEVMDRYMRIMSADIELTRAFGSVDMADAIKAVSDEYAELVRQVPKDNLKEIKRLQDQRNKDIRDLEGVRDVIRGNYGDPTYDNLWARGAGVLRSWNYATLMGGMTVSALPDVANKVLSHGILGLTQDLLVPMITDLKKFKLAAREAQVLGIAVEQVLQTRIASLADIGDTYGRSTGFERGIGAITNHFSKMTGMNLWNDVMKASDYIAATNRAIRGMSRPGRMGKATKTWLANLGIGEAEYGRIMAQVRKHGTTSGGMKLANANNWDDYGAKQMWIAAMGKNSNIQTVTVGKGDKLLSMNRPLGETIGQFKSFVLASNQRVAIRAAQQTRMGQGRVVSFFATAISIGMLVYHLKTVTSGRKTSDDPVTWVREGIDRSGVAAVFMEGFNSAEKITGQSFVGDSPASRFASRGQFTSMVGPSLGRAEDVASAISSLSDGTFKDRDIHAIRKLIPYQNLFYIRAAFDELEITMTEGLGAEETRLSERRERPSEQIRDLISE